MPAAGADDIYALRPDWVRGSISLSDARFLYERVAHAATDHVVEIGTAVGVSAAVTCAALASRATDFSVTTYDNETTYHDDKPIGAAIEAMLPPEQRGRIKLRNPATALDVRAEHEPDTLSFVFIDANHKHPWPALDLLAILPCLAPGAEVVLHDINLPVHHPSFPDWGAKRLFDGLEGEKRADPDLDPPNIGSVVVPDDKDAVRARLLEIVATHEWEDRVPAYLTEALLP